MITSSRGRRRIAALVSTTLVAATPLVLTATGPTASPASAKTSEPIAAKGVLPDGAADVRVDVQATGAVLAKTPVGASVPSWTVPDDQVITDSGRYAVQLDPLELGPEFRTPDGVVRLRISAAATDGRYWATDVSTRAVRTSTSAEPAWAEPVTTSGRLRDTGTATAAIDSRASIPVLQSGATRRDGRTAAVSTDGVASALNLIGTTGSRPVDLDASPSAAADTGCPWNRVLDRERRMATIGTAYPIDGDRAWMYVEHARGGRYGTATAINNVKKMRKSGSAWAPGGWSAKWTPLLASRSFRTEVQYKLVHYGRRDTQYDCIREYVWTPAVEMGGNWTNKGIKRPDFRTCTKVNGAQVWSRLSPNGKPYTLSYGVSISGRIGFNLSVTKNYAWSEGNKHAIRYRLTKKRRICGNNDFPSLSGKQMERYYK